MAPEKRNKFLDAEESEDDGSQGYDSEAEELRKGGRSAKRRKFSENEAASDSDGEDAVSVDGDKDEDEVAHINEDLQRDEGGRPLKQSKESQKDEVFKVDDKSATPTDTATELPDVTRPLTKKNLVASEKATRKSGLVYVSRIPPYMKPTKLRQLLEPYGTINRIFLSPEDPQEHARRVKAGGNKKRMYTDGWVEFVDKKDAKNVVDLLNARTIGGPKGSYYRDDIWSLRYLKGFKWNHLTQQIAAEAAERTCRMMAEISKSTRENKEFVRNIEKGKMLDGIQSKSAAKKSKAEESASGATAFTDGTRGQGSKSVRQFKQASVGRKAAEKAPDEAKRVLSKLF
ncbi:hypothetical protein DL764_006955 [Monosporascus ibericus]|uniref:18S rRNA factor 2 n=1 Tax=Monosporascus ibericus TaxID=155417 RepID=A0A4Q4T3E7_9PEZI|nr:hypothetical protein DL764_006955 [Monosporascus ibericus]